MVAHSSTASSSSTSSSIRSTATSSSSGDTPQRHTVNDNEDNGSSAVDKPSTTETATTTMTTEALADKDSVTTVPDANRCRYKARKCDNARSIKRNGHLHQLCPYHRDIANQNQRKFDNQKRNWQSDLQKVEDKQVRLSAAAAISILSEKSLFARRKIARQARRHCAASSSDHLA